MATITCRAKHRTHHIEVAADSVNRSARPSEVNQRRQKTATAGRTTCRPEAIRPAMDLLPIDEQHIHDI
jgi:hypothetical protein